MDFFTQNELIKPSRIYKKLYPLVKNGGKALLNYPAGDISIISLPHVSPPGIVVNVAPKNSTAIQYGVSSTDIFSMSGDNFTSYIGLSPQGPFKTTSCDLGISASEHTNDTAPAKEAYVSFITLYEALTKKRKRQ